MDGKSCYRDVSLALDQERTSVRTIMIFPGKLGNARLLAAQLGSRVGGHWGRTDDIAVMARGAGMSAILRFSSAGLSLATQVVLARLMGADQYGLYAVIFSSVSVLALPLALGLDISIIRFVPGHIFRNEGGFIRGLIRRAFQVEAILGLSAAIVWAFGSYWIVGQHLGATILAGSGLIVVELGLVAILTAILRALHKIGRAQFPTDILDPLLLIAAILAFRITTGSVGATQAVLAKAFTLVAVIALLGFWARRSARPLIGNDRPLYTTTRWIGVGIPLILIGGSVVLLGRMDVLMVSALVSPTEAGIYMVALKIGTLMEMVMAAVNTIAAPMIAGLHARNDHRGLERLLRTTAKTVFVIVLAVGAFVILAGSRLLGFFGPEFQQGRHALSILVIGWAAASIVAPVDLLGGMTGHQRSTSMVMIAALILNAALNLILIPRWGIEGAAWASVITLIAWRGFLAVYLGRRLGINPSILPITVRGRGGLSE